MKPLNLLTFTILAVFSGTCFLQAKSPGEKLDQVVDSTKNQVSKVHEQAKTKAKNAKDKASKVHEQAKTKAKNAKDKASKVHEQAKTKAKNAKDQLKEGINAQRDKLGDAIKSS